MPVYVKSGHRVNVSGEQEVARYEAAGYSLERAPEPDKAPAKKAASKPSKK